MNRTGITYSVCEVLREIYFATDNPDIKLKCRIATSMAKAMAAKLSEYNSEWKGDFFEKLDDVGERVRFRRSKIKS